MGAKSALDACQGREQLPPTTKRAKATAMAAFTRMTYPLPGFPPGCT